MNTYQWFKRFGWFYLPVSLPGIVIWVMALIFCITVFMAADRHAHSVSDLFYDVFPFLVPTFLVLDWIGGRASGKAAQGTGEPAFKNPDKTDKS